MERKFAFFDVDYVILKKDLYRLLLEYSMKHNFISSWNIPLFISWLLLFKLNLLNSKEVIRVNLTRLRGMKVEDFKKISREIFEDARRYIYDEARELIENMRKDGYELAILSANLRYMLEPLAEELKIPYIISIELNEKDGVFTGEAVEPICVADGKLYWLKKFSEDVGVCLEKSYFFSDSFYDISALSAVGNPVAVNPDFKLKKYAQKNGWKIINFKK